MKISTPRVRNSLGTLTPKSISAEWGWGKDDQMQLTKRGAGPCSKPPLSQGVLDELKLKIATAVASQFSPGQIRAHSLANLHRWQQNGVWASAYEQWKQLMESGSDELLIATMLGRDDNANRLRQSPPYIGLLPREQVRALNEGGAG